MDTPVIDHGVDKSKTYGPMLIAAFVATAFWGITCLQTLMYFVNYEGDGWRFKTLVVILWLLDTAHEVLCIYAGVCFLICVRRNLIPRFDPRNYYVDLEPMYMIPVTGAVALIAQGFYTWRVWRFSKKKIFLIILVPLTLTEFVLSILLLTGPVSLVLPWTNVAVTGNPSAETPGAYGNIVFILSLVYTISDIFIAVVMCVFLNRGRTGFKSTDGMVVRLITASVSTGACTAVFATLSLALVKAQHDTYFFFLGNIPLSTLYCNAVLANLNSRNYLRGSDVVINSAFNCVSVGTSMEMGPVFSTLVESDTTAQTVDRS